MLLTGQSTTFDNCSIAELIAAWPRRRSRCILQPKEVRVRLPEEWTLPELGELREECRKRCTEATGVERAEPLLVRYAPKAKKTGEGGDS